MMMCGLGVGDLYQLVADGRGSRVGGYVWVGGAQDGTVGETGGPGLDDRAW